MVRSIDKKSEFALIIEAQESANSCINLGGVSPEAFEQASF